MIGAEESRRRGSPLAILGLLLVAWVAGRAILWESPFAANPLGLPDAVSLLAEKGTATNPQPPRLGSKSVGEFELNGPKPSQDVSYLAFGHGAGIGTANIDTAIESDSPFPVHPRTAAGHQLLWLAALGHMPMPRVVEDAFRANQTSRASLTPSDESTPPFSPQALASGGQRMDSWSLDTWAFWREGSNAAPISQGRVPIYGASQVGASLRYRFAPKSALDPLLYGRAYRALVNNGETELAAGVAAKPVAALPIRAFAELRYTDNAFGDEIRPAAFAVTELPPVALPLGLRAEAYAQGGYVGGDDPTLFADGQIIVSRELASFDLASAAPAKLSVGAGAWGGAQEDATRLDLGPTVRLDLSIGRVPARVSVDWREQVAGDAAPASGVAATLSTRF